MNIFIPIRRNGRAFPDRAALVLDGKDVTYDQLLRTTALAASRLQEAGVAQGDSVGLSSGHPGGYLLLALALARMGATVTPFDVNWPSERASAVVERHQIRVVISDHGGASGDAVAPGLRYLSAPALLAPPARGAALNVPQVAMDVSDQPWLIALSSGTTGTPKSIPQTHERAILYCCLAMSQMPAAEFERVLVFAGLHLSMSMNAILPQLVAGRTVVLTTGRKPEDFFTAVERDKPTRLLTSTGNMLRLVAHARSIPDSLGKCRSLRAVSIGGSAASPALCAEIAQRFCSQVEILYGSSEAGRVAVADSQTLAAHPDSAGRLCPWVEMEAVDEDGNAMEAGKAGQLRVKTPVLAGKYIGDAAATAKAFRDGWYYPGDTGSVDSSGNLTLTGRVDDLLNLGGNKIDPFVIEAVLDAQPGVEESVVVAFTTQTGAPALIGLVVSSGEFDEQGLRKACLDRLGARYVPRRIRRVPSIPRNAGGKVMRREIALRMSKLGPDTPPAGEEG